MLTHKSSRSCKRLGLAFALSCTVHGMAVIIFFWWAFMSHDRRSLASPTAAQKPFYPTLIALLPQGSSQGTVKPQITPASPALGNPQATVASSPTPAASPPPSTPQTAQPMADNHAAPTLKKSESINLEELSRDFELITEATKTYLANEISTKPIAHTSGKKGTKEQAKKTKRLVTAAELKRLALAQLLKKDISRKTDDEADSALENSVQRLYALTKEQLANAKSSLSTQQEGSFGESGGIADIEKSFKYFSYAKRIHDEGLNSVKTVFAKLPLRRKQAMNTARSAAFAIEIDKDGYLTHLELKESSGNPEFDELIKQAYIQAQPFSPIPKHLGIERYRPTGTSIIQLNSLF